MSGEEWYGVLVGGDYVITIVNKEKVEPRRGRKGVVGWGERNYMKTERGAEGFQVLLLRGVGEEVGIQVAGEDKMVTGGDHGEKEGFEFGVEGNIRRTVNNGKEDFGRD